MTVNILGTPYAVIIKKFGEEEAFERQSVSGFCDGFAKEITICDMHTYKGWEREGEQTIIGAQKQTLQHEIVHAFLNESGLMSSAHIPDTPWAINEEMVDWIALQGVKIYTAWQEVGAL